MPWEYHVDARGHRHYRRSEAELGLVEATPEDEIDLASMKKDALVEYAIEKGIDATGTKAEIIARLEAAL